MSCIRSAHWLAAPPVTLAAIRFGATWPGASAPNISWVTLPIAPIGVTLVSPETRPATTASTNDTSTPSTATGRKMSNRITCSVTDSATAATAPRISQVRLTSPLSSLEPSPPLDRRNEAASERHENANDVSDDVTIIATPGHSSHLLSWVNHAASGLPAAAQPSASAIGASTAYAMIEPSISDSPARRPMRPPTPTIKRLGSRANVRLLAVTVEPVAVV